MSMIRRSNPTPEPVHRASKPKVPTPPPEPPKPTSGELAFKAMQRFWGEGPGSLAQMGELAQALRKLEPRQIRLLRLAIPPGVSGTDIGNRCNRLRDLLSAVLEEG